ncbi:MAG: 23S rRNA (adenine(2030)-N(6))-methyltransferase RlmJ [Thiotrichales bacterium]|nr:23S rRNA (adenine(2030)-N(6))-methyltransferase RlmJ [Thiotrichales bacterium]
MLSYLHGFHAGNFADVLKHLVSVQILNYLTDKPKPLFYLDTHAGSGGFALLKAQAQKTQEYQNGIGKLWEISEPLPAAVADYLEQVRQFNPQPELKRYPGSPWFAQSLLRDEDRASLFELHPKEFADCHKKFSKDRRFRIYQEDGFHACMAQLPPREKRGYVLMDPPYEVKQDYRTAVDTLIQAHKKFATGTYALWYPVVERSRIIQMEKRFIASGIRNIQRFELGIASDILPGMNASGMIVINPPWTLKSAMDDCLPFLANALGDRQGFYRSEQLVPE